VIGGFEEMLWMARRWKPLGKGALKVENVACGECDPLQQEQLYNCNRLRNGRVRGNFQPFGVELSRDLATFYRHNLGL
jgi:hypothetical protein